MVKHQRRSHQRGIHSSEIDDGDSSDSDSGDSPSTPRHSSHIQWPNTLSLPHGVVPMAVPHHPGAHLNRPQSLNEFPHMDAYPVGQSYGHRSSFNGSQFTSTLQETENHMVNRNASLPPHGGYFVTEQNNPGIATLNASTAPLQPYIPRHQVDSKEGIIHSSPSSPSTNSRGSPDGYYPQQSHQPSYSLHTSNHLDQASLMQQYQPIPQHLPSQNTQMNTPLSHQGHIQPQFQSPASDHSSWFESGQYQQPELISVYQTPSFQPYIEKIESYTDDPAFQLPSARLDNL